MSDKISEALDTSFEAKKPEEVKKELVQSKKEVKVDMDDSEKDYIKIRSNLYELINNGKEAIDGILKVASEGDAPRAYEVVAGLLKTVADVNKDLMDLHKQVKDVNKDETIHNHNTTNAIYVGSTSELQDLINPERSRNKEIIDVNHEVKEDDK